MIGPRGERLSWAEFIAGAELSDLISSVNLANLPDDFRLDAEHYKPEYLRIDARLSTAQTKMWGELDGAFIVGPFGSEFTVDRYVENSPFRYIRGKDVKPFFVLDNDNAYMPRDDYKRLSKYALVEGDLLTSVVGTLGNVAIVNEGVGRAIFSCKSTAYRSSTLDSHYLLAYLNSSIGQAYLQRKARGAVQLGLNLPDLKSVPIFLPAREEIKAIGDLVRQSWYNLSLSKQLYTEAENLLLAALGLDTLDLSPQLAYTGTFEEMNGADRFDSEYFQPKYQRAMELLGAAEQKIGTVARLSKRRFVPKNGKPFQYIEISDVTNDGRVEASETFGEDAPSRAQFIVHSGDVITSTVRPIRRLSALVEPQQHGDVCSSGFAVLQPLTIEPELLLVYLRLPIIAEILDLHTTASMYPAISTTDLLNIPIAVPGNDVSQQIVAKVKESRASGVEARKLLETAKQQVEQMILGEVE